MITCNLGKQEKASWYPRAHAARTADSLSCIEAFRMFSVASHMHGACRLPSSEGGTVDEDANDIFEVILLACCSPSSKFLQASSRNVCRLRFKRVHASMTTSFAEVRAVH